MAEIVARVGKITGEAFARDADGNVRRLKSGDPVREGEVVQAAPGGQVEMRLADGRPVTVGANEAAKFDAEVAGGDLPDAGDSAVQNAPQVFAKVSKTVVGQDGTFSFDDGGGLRRRRPARRPYLRRTGAHHRNGRSARLPVRHRPRGPARLDTRRRADGTPGTAVSVTRGHGDCRDRRLSPASDSGTAGDTTNDETPTIRGTGELGVTVTVTTPAGEVLTAPVAADGTWSVTPTVSRLRRRGQFRRHGDRRRRQHGEHDGQPDGRYGYGRHRATGASLRFRRGGRQSDQ